MGVFTDAGERNGGRTINLRKCLGLSGLSMGMEVI